MPERDEEIEIEQMIRYLCTQENHFTISQFNGGVDVFSACSLADESKRKLGTGATLREALAAACAEVKERMNA